MLCLSEKSDPRRPSGGERGNRADQAELSIRQAAPSRPGECVLHIREEEMMSGDVCGVVHRGPLFI